MATPINSIGPFTFIVLDGNPDVLNEQIELISRKGLDGHGKRLLGRKGRVFTLRSKVDTGGGSGAAGMQIGRQMLREYKELIGGPAVTLIWNDADLAAEGVEVDVLGVRQAGLQAIATSTGSLNGGAAWLVAEWDLVLTEA